MNGRNLRWLALAAILSLAACGGSDAAPDADSAESTQDPDAAQVDPQAGPPPTTDVSGTPPPEPETKGPTPIVRSKADGPSRPSPVGQRYTDCIAKASQAGEGERALLEASCASLPDAPKQN